MTIKMQTLVNSSLQQKPHLELEKEIFSQVGLLNKDCEAQPALPEGYILSRRFVHRHFIRSLCLFFLLTKQVAHRNGRQCATLKKRPLQYIYVYFRDYPHFSVSVLRTFLTHLKSEISNFEKIHSC